MDIKNLQETREPSRADSGRGFSPTIHVLCGVSRVGKSQLASLLASGRMVCVSGKFAPPESLDFVQIWHDDYSCRPGMQARDFVHCAALSKEIFDDIQHCVKRQRPSNVVIDGGLLSEQNDIGACYFRDQCATRGWPIKFYLCALPAWQILQRDKLFGNTSYARCNSDTQATAEILFLEGAIVAALRRLHVSFSVLDMRDYDYTQHQEYMYEQFRMEIDDTGGASDLPAYLARVQEPGQLGRAFYRGFEVVPGVVTNSTRLAIDSQLANKILDECKGRSILDIGSCEGWLCFEAARRGAWSVLGVNTYRTEIEVAKQLRHYAQANCMFLEASIENPAVRIAPRDFVYVLNVLHHLANPVNALLTCARLAQERLVLEVHAPAASSGTLIESALWGEQRKWLISEEFIKMTLCDSFRLEFWDSDKPGRFLVRATRK